MRQASDRPDQLERDLTDLFARTSADVDPAALGHVEAAANRRRRRRDLGAAFGSALVVSTLVDGAYAVPRLVDTGPVGVGEFAVVASADPTQSVMSTPTMPCVSTPTAPWRR